MNPSGLSSIEVWINGEARQAPPGISVAGLLSTLNIAPGRVAVELDRAIVRRADWETTRVEPGARLEIVQFVGGG